MNKQCDLCQQIRTGTNEFTYYGFEVFVCSKCKGSEQYLEQVEGMTKCLCENWFDPNALRTHLHKGSCCTPKLIGFDPALPGGDTSITFIHNEGNTHAI